MEWTKYKRLGKELKEEYNFMFHNKSTYFNTTYSIILLIVLLLILITGVFLFFIVYTTPQLESIIPQAKLIWDNTMRISVWGIYLIIPMIVWNYCVQIYKGWKYVRWMRKNKIPIMPDWMVRMFGSKK